MAVVCPKGHQDVQALLSNSYQCVICGETFRVPAEKKRGVHAPEIK